MIWAGVEFEGVGLLGTGTASAQDKRLVKRLGILRQSRQRWKGVRCRKGSGKKSMRHAIQVCCTKAIFKEIRDIGDIRKWSTCGWERVRGKDRFGGAVCSKIGRGAAPKELAQRGVSWPGNKEGQTHNMSVCEDSIGMVCYRSKGTSEV